MSKWDKLINRILSIPNDVRFEELRNILESYGYTMHNNGGSHYIFKKAGEYPITIPKHNPIKKVYVKMVRKVIEENEKNRLLS